MYVWGLETEDKFLILKKGNIKINKLPQNLTTGYRIYNKVLSKANLRKLEIYIIIYKWI